jgi:tellurite resistance protein
MAKDWSQTGERIVNSSADFFSGVGSAFKGVGNRFKRSKFAPFVEALCAVVGDVASQNGRLHKEEIEEFRKFLLQNCRDTPILDLFSLDELAKKLEQYAVAAFLCDEEAVLMAVRKIEDPELARLIILSALAVAAADGDCDAKEQACIEQHAATLQVNMSLLADQFQLNLNKPQSSPPAASAPPLPPPSPAGAGAAPQAPQQAPPAADDLCLMCKGAGGSCVFCKGTGRRLDRRT